MEMLAKQKAIYQGLKNIGEELSGFYKSGLMLIETESIPSRSYMIAHSAREIDGSLRDFLAPDDEKKKLEKTLSLDSDLKKRKGHIASILTALDLPVDEPFAREYIDVATKFVEYTHRRGGYKTSRNAEEISSLWSRYEDILLKLLGDFIKQIKQLERIIKYENPSEEILFTLKNILLDNQKEHYFFKNLIKDSWFIALYENGFFSPETIKDESYWNQSEYLEFLAIEINKGKIEEGLSILLVEIVEDIGTYSINIQPIKNYRIWYTLLVILTNLPKKYVNDIIINQLPIYFTIEPQNVLTSNEIFNFINTYFENEEVSKHNKSRIEKIIKLVFEVSNDQRFRDTSTYETGNHYPIIRAYRLREACENDTFYSGIANYCSNEVIFHIANKLLISLKSEFDGIINSIFYPNELQSHSYSVKSIYTTFLKNVCVKISDESPERIQEVIHSFLSQKYSHRHFIKLSLFLFAKTWENTKEIFFQLIENEDERKLFSSNYWGDDLYFLIEEIAEKLNEDEAMIFKDIIERGSQDEHYYNKKEYFDNFRLLWYSALSENIFFKKPYNQLSKKLKLTKKQVRPKIESGIIFGSTSPISSKKIKSLPIDELISYLKEFDPERSFRNPSVDGLADNLGIVIKEKPEIFYLNHLQFLKVPYKHISTIFYSLSDAHKTGILIDWKNTLDFIYQYISQSEFSTDKLQFKNDPYDYDYSSTIISFCRLMSQGMRNDDIAFPEEFLPMAEKNIFLLLEKYISNKLDDKHVGKLGSAMQVVNSRTGVIIGCLLDYSLRKGRLKKQLLEDKTPIWSLEEKSAFDKLINNNIQEVLVLLGWHINNFYFLDFEWTKKQLKSIPQKNDQSIMSFFGGHLLNYPTSIFEYNTLKDIYKKHILSNWQIVDSSMGNTPLETHILIFYIYNYENLNEGELLTLLLNKKEINSIKSIVHSLSFKFSSYRDGLITEEKIKFKDKILKLWRYILKLLDTMEGIESKDFPSLIYLIKYIDQLNEESTQLILKSSSYARHGRDLDELIKNLNRLKIIGNVRQNCIYACEIFIDSFFKDFYYASIMQKEILEFVEFLYLQNDLLLSEKSNKICNEFAKNGQYFLRDLYEKYNK